jgi:hypothetical protein
LVGYSPLANLMLVKLVSINKDRLDVIVLMPDFPTELPVQGNHSVRGGQHSIAANNSEDDIVGTKLA